MTHKVSETTVFGRSRKQNLGARQSTNRRWAIINKGRYRRRTPDRQYQGRMREALKSRLDAVPAQISRGEIEAIGADIGLEDPIEATRLFDRLKGVSWRGDYITSDGNVWTAARVTDLN